MNKPVTKEVETAQLGAVLGESAPQVHSNTARIAKNTLMLYFRQILIMLVSLYTVRVVLNTLGVEDYGIYNLVAGGVVMFGFLNAAMTSATQRFFNFALGQNDIEQARNIYSVSFVLHIFIAVLVVILAETIGLWFFYNWLNMPLERRNAAFVVYQLSVLSTVTGILQIPYRATIIAYEKMSFFAFSSIIEALLKLGSVFLLTIILYDKLVIYAFFVFIIGIILFFVYKVYCNKTFTIAHFRYSNDKKLFRQLIGFSSWSIFGGVASMSSSYGTNILLNIFYGVTVNAAVGIATLVNTAVYQLVSNFQTAFNPQIIKSYSAQNYDYFMRLIFRTSKASFYLLFLFVLPLYVNMEFVLQIWLKNVPEYTIVFTRLILIFSLVDAISAPLWMSIQATGDIKKYQLIVSCFIFANLPLSLLFLWCGFNPVCVLLIKIGLNILTLIWRMFFLKGRISLPIKDFLREIIVPVLIITLISGFIAFLFYNLFIGWNRLLLSSLISLVNISCLVYLIGLNKQERVLLHNWAKLRISFLRG